MFAPTPTHRRALILLATLGLLVSTRVALGQTTSFTYQGELKEGGTPANANYDLQFTLWDALTGGTQQPQPTPITVTRLNVAVANGIFTVQLDFGANGFPAADRFLEIGVKPAGSAVPFTVLTPRQQITATPYAIRSLGAGGADSLSSACVGCVQDANINSVSGSKGSGAIPVASVPAGSANYIQNTTTQQPSSNFNINGDGTVAGTLSANIVNATTQYNIAGQRVLSTAGTLNTFLGLGSGQANTAGSANTFCEHEWLRQRLFWKRCRQRQYQR